MRVKRGKFVRKYLKFFKLVFGIDTPYHIILDGNFVFQACKYKLEIKDRLSRLLQDCEVRLYIQKSSLDEMKAVGPKAKDSYDFATKMCSVVDDSNISGEVPSSKLVNMLENLFHENMKNTTASKKKMRYMVATQDKDLRSQLNSIPGVPLIYFNKVSLVLEPPSDTSKSFNDSLERSKVSANQKEIEVASSLKKSGTVVGNLPAVNESSSQGHSSHTSAHSIPVDTYSQRKKRKALDANPLASMQPSKDSINTKRRKVGKFVRRK